MDKPEAFFYCQYGGLGEICSDCKRNHKNSIFETNEIHNWYVPHGRRTGGKSCSDYIGDKTITQQLEYGKWYSCSECMPEDFEELSSKDMLYTTTVIVGTLEYPKAHYLDSRTKRNGVWIWTNNHYKETTHWMAVSNLENK